MVHRYPSFDTFAYSALAAAYACVLTLLPGLALAGTYTTDAATIKLPRWSNDRHHEHGVIVQPDCIALAPGIGADYVPGRDAWGRQVIPAQPLQGFQPSFPMGVELDVNLGTKTIAGKDIELHGGHLAFDPTTGTLDLNGHPWMRDCFPSPK